MRRSTLLVAGLLALAPAPALALDPGKPLSSCTVDVWGVRNGLPGWIRAIAQTPEGYLWVGTQLGLSRYGGGPVVTVRPERALDRASDVMGLMVARDGTLWITPSRGDPVCLQGGVMSECLPVGQRLSAGTRITDLQQDREGAVWMATAEGISRFAGGRLALVHPAGALPFTRVNALHPDRTGRLWVGAPEGLFVWQGHTFVRRPEMAGNVSAFAEPEGGALWVASDRQLLELDHGPPLGAAEGFPGDRPRTMVVDRDGNVWLDGNGGLTRYQRGRGFVRFGRGDGLPDDDVTALYQDREGSLWVGTRGGGLAQFTDRTLDGEAGPPSLRHRWINSLAEDDEGALWVGSRLGLTRWKDGRERTFTRADGLPADNVIAVRPDRGTIWIGTERGLARLRDGRVEVLAPAGQAVSALYLDEGGTLWLGSARGLARVEGDRVELLPVEEGLQLNEIRSLQQDDQGTLWISAGGKLLELENGRVVRPPASALGRVRSMARDGDGTLWLATYDGLVRRRGGVWKSFGPEEGLTQGDLYEVVSDDRGFLWVGAGHGLHRIGRQSLAEAERGRGRRVDLLSFEESDQRREVGALSAHQPAAWRGRGGRLWFATSRGVVSVDPHRLTVNSLPPSVRIEEAFVDGRPARRGAANAFGPGSGALEFHFAGITLLEPHKAQHRYRLEGFERSWVEAGARRDAYYTNIPPGHYRFRVQASNADGVWNEAGDTLELKLAPHFYQTWWCYGALALAALGLVFSFHRMRMAEVHSRYLATFAERTRMARELHDSLLQGMSAAVMHLRGLRKRLASAPAETLAGDLKEVEGLLASNVAETRRLVWDLRDDDPGLETALRRLVQRLAGGRSVEARVVVSGTERSVAPPVRHELIRIASEAVTNALDHAGAAHITVDLSYHGEGVKLTVSDDGRGFDPGQAPGADQGHFGLAGMRERAVAVGAFTLDSNPGAGTRVQVEVKGHA